MTILYHPGKANVIADALSRKAVKPWGKDLLRESLDKVKLIQDRLLMDQSRQKSYADRKVGDLEFMVGERVLLKVSPMKGVMRFEKKDNLSPRYISTFEIVECIGEVAYQLTLPLGLSGVHPVFHILMLKKCQLGGAHVIQWDSVFLDHNLTFEEESTTMLDRKIRKLRSKKIASVTVHWKNRPVEEATWETKSDMKSRYPQLFKRSACQLEDTVAEFDNLPKQLGDLGGSLVVR
ncbi:uncharacterized protein [Solanum lycopersicum]|uniref:uncharacterized protein n=1 Tax=Solanum lycopersicum TaxID=4081 RepID=UPI000532AEE9|nr:uncharacterized protein LOC101268367 [Solanum lycopersicum]